MLTNKICKKYGYSNNILSCYCYLFNSLEVTGRLNMYFMSLFISSEHLPIEMCIILTFKHNNLLYF